MENASKALLIGAGILIAVLTIGGLTYMFTTTTQFFHTEEGTLATEQLTAFNKEYTSYNKKLLRGTDVVSVCNKAINNNEKYLNEEEYRIVIYFKLVEEINYYTWEETDIIYGNGGASSALYMKEYKIDKNVQYDMTKMQEIKSNKICFDEFKRKVFNCTETKYNNLGRICEMTFVEQKVDQ